MVTLLADLWLYATMTQRLSLPMVGMPGQELSPARMVGIARRFVLIEQKAEERNNQAGSRSYYHSVVR